MKQKITKEKLDIVVEKISKATREIEKVIIGQSDLIEALFIALIANGHILLEWVPGLAKTESIKSLAQVIWWKFNRVSFTPDLLPSDIIGWHIFNQQTSKFHINKWPIFANFLLWDEINRAPAKIQSALLESMQERQVTIWEETFILPEPFLVMATQNPIEQEWTFQLPEAQIDRFLIKVIIDYPDKKSEIEIVKKNIWKEKLEISKIISIEEIMQFQKIASEVYIDNELLEFIINITCATRNPENYWMEDLKTYIEYWASPRASIAIAKCAQIKALMNWKDHTSPDEVKQVAHMCLRHRIWLTYRADSEWVNQDYIISEILNNINIT